MNKRPGGIHVVLSYGDVFRQSGYRTKVLGELQHYEKNSNVEPYLIVFDRDAKRIDESNLFGIRFKAHPRSFLPLAALRYLRDLRLLAREAPIRSVHAHNLYSGALALIGRWFHHYRVIVELHGRIPEEYLILAKGGHFSYWLLKH